MPAPRGFTATTAAVKDAADRALAEPDGLTITWRDADYGPAVTAAKSRSFQCSFSSLRARARRMKAQHYGHSTDALDMETQGTYDRLACVRSPLPDNSGWSVSLIPASALYESYEMTNAKTGEPIVGETPDARRKTRIVMAAQNAPDAVTPEDWAWLETQIPGIQEDFRPWFAERRPDLYMAQAVKAHSPPPELDALFGHDPVDRSVAPVPVRPTFTSHE